MAAAQQQDWVFVGTKLDGRLDEASIPVLLFDQTDGTLRRHHFECATQPPLRRPLSGPLRC